MSTQGNPEAAMAQLHENLRPVPAKDGCRFGSRDREASRVSDSVDVAERKEPPASVAKRAAVPTARWTVAGGLSTSGESNVLTRTSIAYVVAALRAYASRVREEALDGRVGAVVGRLLVEDSTVMFQ